MKCGNCGFQNMPGSDVCGRCSTSLTIATAVMDVHPPRASQMTRRLRRVLPVPQAVYRTRDAFHNAHAMPNIAQMLPPRSIVLRLVFPGWSHFYLDQPVRGHLFMWGFLACLFLMFLNYGTGWGSFWLGMAFSVHSWAALSIVTQTFAEAGSLTRIGRSLGVSFALVILLYVPVGWLVCGVAQPHSVVTAISPFQPGDVIVVNNWAKPKRGSVVLYNFQYQSAADVPGHERIAIYEGENIDRVLAVPGDRVECRDGVLFINGEVSSILPLNLRKLPAKVDFVVKGDCYLILPSGVPGFGNLEDPGLWRGSGSIKGEAIFSVAYFQSSPLFHMHVIH